MLASRPKTLHQRMHAVLCAEIIVLIDTPAEVSIVIEQVVRAMGQEQPERDNDPRQPGEMPAAPGKQTGNCS